MNGAAQQYVEAPLPIARRRALAIAVGVFVTAFCDIEKLAKLPLQRLIKDDFGHSPAAMADFFAVAGLMAYMIPLAVLLNDRLPLFGSRRRSYLLLSSLAAALLWLLTAAAPRAYGPLLVCITALNAAVVFAGAAVAGLIADEKAKGGATSHLSALRVSMKYTAQVAAGTVGGYLATVAFGFTCALGALLAMAVALSAWLLVDEPVAAAPREPLLESARRLWSAPFLGAAAFLVFFFAAPGYWNLIFYHQTNTLGLDTGTIGILRSVNGVFGLLAAAVYARYGGRFSPRRLAAGVALFTASTLVWLGYRSLPAAILTEAADGFLGGLGLLAVQELTIRAAPRGFEAVGYSLLLGASLLSGALSEVIGTRIESWFQLSIFELIVVSAAASAVALLLVPLLPRALFTRPETAT
ncbi:MFS transporter [Sorangium sp. So ce362]|uniref:MFS transporter n=1 Tax=Sorangium sp. So ce362 TaxID=3133303 RepID=UPI003F648A83